MAKHELMQRHLGSAGLIILAALQPGWGAEASAQTKPDVPAEAPTATTASQSTAAAAPVPGDDIVVTARRAAERLQSVPISITALTQEGLRAANINNTEDLMMKTPGVFLAGSASRENSVFSIRGQSKALSGPGAAAVVSYFADVPQPTFGSSVVTYDMASVQVLKGPQGTLFGRNTTGGAVLFYPVAPTYDFKGYLEGTYGRFDERLIDGAFTVPIIDQHLSVRVAGRYEKSDGYTKNIDPVEHDRQDNVNSRAFRVSILAEPIDGVKNVTIVDYYRNRSNGNGAVLIGVNQTGSDLLSAYGLRNAMLAALAEQRARGPFVVDDDMPGNQQANRFGVTNRTDIDLGGSLSLVNIFGYRSTRLFDNANVDGVGVLTTDGTGFLPAGVPIQVLNSGFKSRIEQYTDEVQFHGRSFGDKLTWIIGGFGLESRPNGPTGTFASVGTTPGVSTGNFNYSFYTEKSRAIFANAAYDLGDLVAGLKFNAGFRYTWDKTSACTAADTGIVGRVNPADCDAANTSLIDPSTNRTKSSAPTWTVGLDWQANRNLFFYLTSRRGYRTGGINSPTLGGTLTSVQSFGPEKVTDGEIGARTDWTVGDVKIRFNTSLFVGYYDKVQIALAGVQTQPGCVAGDPVFGAPPYSPDGNCNAKDDPASGTLLINAGKSRVAGIDFDGRIAFSRRFDVTFGGNLLDTKTLSLNAPAALSSYLPSQIPFNLTAKKTFTAGATYTIPLQSMGNIVVNGDFYYSGRIFFSNTYLPAYEIANLRVDWNDVAGKTVDLSAFITNLFDKHYAATGAASADSLGFTTAVYGAPREFGVSLRYRWGK